MNSLQQCDTCKINHPHAGFVFAQSYCWDPKERGFINVEQGCRYADECAKALAGATFEKFTVDRTTGNVNYTLFGKKATLMTCNGYNGEKEMGVKEIHQMIYSKFREVMYQNAQKAPS